MITILLLLPLLLMPLVVEEIPAGNNDKVVIELRWEPLEDLTVPRCSVPFTPVVLGLSLVRLTT